MKKFSIILLLSCICYNAHAITKASHASHNTHTQATSSAHNAHDIHLESEVLHLVDGIFIREKHYGIMIKSRNQTKDVQFGKKDAAGNYLGNYTLQGDSHSIRTLATFEAQLIEEKNKREQTILNEPTRSRHEHWEQEELNFNNTMNELHKILIKAKKDFVENASGYLNSAQEGKKQMQDLIAESCIKRHRQDSLLLEWAKTKAGEEMVLFDKRINSFQELDQFCTDLVNFLEDMLRSCPKAKAMFFESMNKTKKAKIDHIIDDILKARGKAAAGDEVKKAFYSKNEETVLKMAPTQITPEVIGKMLTPIIG